MAPLDDTSIVMYGPPLEQPLTRDTVGAEERPQLRPWRRSGAAVEKVGGLRMLGDARGGSWSPASHIEELLLAAGALEEIVEFEGDLDIDIGGSA